jgi:hypothetical protein
MAQSSKVTSHHEYYPTEGLWAQYASARSSELFMLGLPQRCINSVEYWLLTMFLDLTNGEFQNQGRNRFYLGLYLNQRQLNRENMLQ